MFNGAINTYCLNQARNHELFLVTIQFISIDPRLIFIINAFTFILKPDWEFNQCLSFHNHVLRQF